MNPFPHSGARPPRHRVLVTANPMFGHVNAVLPTARAARRAGHDVVVATGPDMVEHVRRHGVEAVAAGPRAAAPRDIHGSDWLALFAAAADRRAHDLVPFARAWRPDVVIHEETELAGAVAAAVTGARHLVHGLGPVPPTRIWDAMAPSLAATGRRWGAPDVADRVPGATYLDLCPPALQPRHESLWRARAALRPAGLVVDGEQLPPSIETGAGRDPAYVTLGTVFNEGNPVLAWAVAALADLHVPVVATTGPGTDPARLALPGRPPDVVIEPYIPQALLLPHCSLVVSQGGSGVMFGALAHGLPQLLLPQGADQFTNAELCVRAGVAIALMPDEVDGSAIAAAARALLDDGSYAAAAAAVRAELDAMPDAGEVLDALLAAPAQPGHNRAGASSPQRIPAIQES